LVLHTGLTLGANLNQWLMLNVLALMGLGAASGIFSALERVLGGHNGPALRRGWTWAHILVGWPVPVLLGVHILTVYYF
jgi:nitrite reductase (NADH) large subunit